MVKKVFLLKEDEKRAYSKMCGKIMLGILEGRSEAYIADSIGLNIHQTNHNIDEMLYAILKQVGIKRYIKLLFTK